ncbi:MAG: heme lyase CcmF/NrfE family subunit [Balneolaceae bacterium]
MLGLTGNLVLSAAFVFALTGLITYALAANRQSERLEIISDRLWIAKGVTILIASAVLIYLIIDHQFQFFYVWNYSSLDLEFHYLLSTFWGGQEGSFMLWILCSFLIGLGLIRWTRKPYKAPVMFVMMLTQVFLISMIIGWEFLGVKLGASPFRTIAQEMPNAPFIQANPGFVPQDGTGLNDLLKSPWMMIHPPVLFIGFAMMTVPFAFAIASLWTRTYNEWIRPALPWTLGANLALLTAIFLGGYWAYETLSFGGYWAWDPVENASFVPWLIGTAGIHAMIIQRKSSRAHKASIFFAILAYIAVVYETFLTRSGVLADQSVHSFVDLGLYGQLLVYMLIMIIIGIGFFMYRYKELPSPEKEAGILTKEFFTFSGSMLLFILGAVIILGTSSPIIGKLFVSNPTPPDISFYNDWSMPIAIIMAFMTVIGQYLYWQKHDWESLAGALITPLLLTSILATLSIVMGGVRDLYYMLYIFAGWFTVIGNGSLMLYLIKKNPKMIGGALTHVGFGVLLLGILASSAYNEQLLDERAANYNLRVEQGEAFDDQGFQIIQKVEMFELKLNRPTLVANKYMVTYEGYTLSDSPRPGQQTYRLKFEPIDGSKPFYMNPDVYPMLTSSTANNIEWSVDPYVRTGLTSDIYLYVAGSGYVAKQNELVKKRNNLQPVSERPEIDDQNEQIIEIKKGETLNAGNFRFTFDDFRPASEEHLPDSTLIGIRSMITVQHEPSGSTYETVPLFAVYTENGRSYTYSPPLELEKWGLIIQFTSVNPDNDSIDLTIRGLEEEFEEDWVVVVAEKKPFVSAVWLGTFLLMGGFSVSIFRHWSREKHAQK